MNHKIKQRIEEIKRGAVPEGYKKIKNIGIISVEWQESPLCEVLHPKIRPVPKPTDAYWRLGLRSHAKGTFHELVKDPQTINMKELYEVKENDLIVNITFAWEHAVALADQEDEGKLVSHRFPTYVFNQGCVPQFYKYVFIQSWFRKMLENISPGGAGRNRVMNKTAFLKLPCYIPPLPEQEKIAEILSTWDKAIELKERQIAEKKKQKKWLAIQFFQNKKTKNLVCLGSVCNIIMGQSPSSTNYNCEYKGKPLIQGNADINKRKANPRIWTTELTRECKPGDLLLSVRAPVGMVAKTDISACIGRGICAITPQIESEYIYQYLLFHENKWNNISQGSTFSAINRDDIKKLTIPISKEKKEIRLVANILSTADKEIDLLERELEQLQKQKKALMQLLLTGIVRVNTASHEAIRR